MREIAIAFATFLTDDCFFNIRGYMMHDQLTLDENSDHNEYQVDELFDYWIENVYNKIIEP
jgi:hypothetical protein